MSTKEIFAKDLKLVKVVVDACDAVFRPDKTILDQYKARFVEGAPSGAFHSSASRGDGTKVGTPGSAPPIAKTRDLHTFAHIESFPAPVYTRIQVKADYKTLREEMPHMLGPLKELSAACKRHIALPKTRKEDVKQVKLITSGDISAPKPPCNANACVLQLSVILAAAFLP